MNTSEQSQHDEQIAKFDFHRIPFWLMGLDEEHSRFLSEVLLL
jgi:hypothetical protein